MMIFSSVVGGFAIAFLFVSVLHSNAMVWDLNAMRLRDIALRAGGPVGNPDTTKYDASLEIWQGIRSLATGALFFAIAVILRSKGM